MRNTLLFLVVTMLSRPAVAQGPWQPTSGPTGGTVTALLSASNGDLFAASLEAGIFRSRDAGDHWTRVRTAPEAHYGIAADGTGRLYAATATGLYVSTDAGDTWALLSGNVRPVYVAVDGSGRIFVVDRHAGFVRSDDGGAQWVGIDPNGDYVIAFAIDSADRIFAGTASGGIFRSDDSGEHWTRSNAPAVGSILAVAIGGDGGVYAGGFGGGVIRSMDLGATWTRLGPVNAAVAAIAVDSDGHVYAATGGMGLQRGNPAGAFFDWYPMHLEEGVRDVQAVVLDAQGRVFAGTFGFGIFRSADGGGAWAAVNDGLTAAQVYAFGFAREQSVFAVSFLNGLYRTADDGRTWEHLWIEEPLSLVLEAEGRLLCGTGRGVYRSDDDGTTWTQLGLGYQAVYTLAVLGSGAIMAGTAWNGIFISTDGGQNWSESNDGLGHLDVHALAALPDGRVLAGTRSGLYGSDDEGAHWSPLGLDGLWVFQISLDSHGRAYARTDYGPYRSDATHTQWTGLEGWPAETGARTLAIDAFDRIWMATTAGVLMSPDGGVSWERHDDGLPEQDMVALGIDPRGGLWTQGRGGPVYRSAQPITSVALSDLTAEPETDGVQVRWRAQFSPGEVTGFRVLRRSLGGGLVEPPEAFETLTPGVEPADAQTYAFLDARPLAGRSLYRVAALSAAGAVVASADVEVAWVDRLPPRDRLAGNFPNPCNPTTTLRFEIARSGPAEIALYDVRGRLVSRLWSDAAAAPGTREARWDGRDAAGRPLGSGVYWARLVVHGRVADVRALTLVR